MARYRLSRPAQADLTHILVTSAERWGIAARRRYAAVHHQASFLLPAHTLFSSGAERKWQGMSEFLQ